MIWVITDPENHPDWSRFKAFLEPARVRGGLDSILEPEGLLWAVYEGSEPIAAATARLTVENIAEVVLVGGRDHQKWLNELSEAIGASAQQAGAVAMRAGGRRGWLRPLTAAGWACLGEENGFTIYERQLAPLET